MPSASFGSSSESSRSSPSSSENSRLQAGGGLFGLGVLLELGQRHVERAAAGRAGGERDGGVLAVVQEALAHELFRSRDVGGTWDGRGARATEVDSAIEALDFETEPLGR